MKFLLGTKLNMTQVWTDDGEAVPVTAVAVSPMTVIQVKDGGKDGYKAVQVGVGTQKESRVSKPVKGHTKGLGIFRFIKEFRLDGDISYKKGDKIEAGVFSAGDAVNVSAVSKGKGFQGVVKRHGFAGGSRTHGQKHSEREPGAIGGGGRAGGRVVKGMRMAGRMGGERITVRNLKVVQIDGGAGLIFIKGAVPGRRGSLVEIMG